MRSPAQQNGSPRSSGEANKIPGLVATVGKIEAKPGATNVIAGETRLTLDVRHGVDEVRTRAVDDLVHEAEEIAQAAWIVCEPRTFF